MQYVIARTSRLGNRAVNQDRVTALERDNTVLLALGDGLGGKTGGEVAAQVMIKTIANAFKNASLPIKQPQDFLTGALHDAHRAVIAAGKKIDPPINPGTTAVLCLIQNGSAWWAHVGDSRLYLFRSGVPIYRTRDHSYVEKLVERGHLKNGDRGTHPLRNYMTRCIGMSNNVPEVTVSNEVRLHNGDVIMLCSDGLWEPIDEMQLGMKIMDGRLSDTLDKLAIQAEEIKHPKSDNISAVALQIMSLQLIGQAINEGIEKQVAKASHLDTVENAINVIEKTMKLYEHEMK